MPRNYPVPYAGDATATNTRDGIIFASASQGVGAVNSQEYGNPGAKGLRLYIDITNVGAAGTLTVKVQIFDPASQKWVDFPLATTTALATTATTTLTIYPGAAETANQDIADPLGGRWRVVATVAANAVTFSIGGEYLF